MAQGENFGLGLVVHQGQHIDGKERIAYFQSLLADENLLKQVLKEELEEIAGKYGDDALASRLSSMTMRIPLRSDSSRMSEMPSSRLSST